MIRIAEIEAGSIADELHLEIGTRIIRINGQRVRDGIDLTFLLAESALELETVNPHGEAISRDLEQRLAAVFLGHVQVQQDQARGAPGNEGVVVGDDHDP